jgi:hypothetical protein
MKKHLLASLSMIQLPMEYLWMTLDYDEIFEKYPNDVKQTGVTITHPECLTGEERAEKDSSAVVSTRIPRGYVRAVENKIKCRDHEIIYEFIHFDEKSNIGAFKPYFEWLSHHKVVTVIPFAKKYGSHNSVANENIKLIQNLRLQVNDKIVFVCEEPIDSVLAHQVSSKREIPALILKYLMNQQHVIYVPKGTRSIRTVLGKAKEQQLDFVTKNVSESKEKIKKEYVLKLDPEYPIYFGTKNKVLRHLLLMSNSIKDLESIFNETYMFLTRIHCGWI